VGESRSCIWAWGCRRCSIGLWEVFGTPAEAYFNGKETTYEVTYGEDDLVSYKLIDFNQAFPKVKEQ
jgi:hypothetical protein